MCSPAARKASLAAADSDIVRAIVGASVPAQLGEPYLAGSRAKLQGAFALFSLFKRARVPTKTLDLKRGRQSRKKKKPSGKYWIGDKTRT